MIFLEMKIFEGVWRLFPGNEIWVWQFFLGNILFFWLWQIFPINFYVEHEFNVCLKSLFSTWSVEEKHLWTFGSYEKNNLEPSPYYKCVQLDVTTVRWRLKIFITNQCVATFSWKKSGEITWQILNSLPIKILAWQQVRENIFSDLFWSWSFFGGCGNVFDETF